MAMDSLGSRRRFGGPTAHPLDSSQQLALVRGARSWNFDVTRVARHGRSGVAGAAARKAIRACIGGLLGVLCARWSVNMLIAFARRRRAAIGKGLNVSAEATTRIRHRTGYARLTTRDTVDQLGLPCYEVNHDG